MAGPQEKEGVEPGLEPKTSLIINLPCYHHGPGVNLLCDSKQNCDAIDLLGRVVAVRRAVREPAAQQDPKTSGHPDQTSDWKRDFSPDDKLGSLEDEWRHEAGDVHHQRHGGHRRRVQLKRHLEEKGVKV